MTLFHQCMDHTTQILVDTSLQRQHIYSVWQLSTAAAIAAAVRHRQSNKEHDTQTTNREDNSNMPNHHSRRRQLSARASTQWLKLLLTQLLLVMTSPLTDIISSSADRKPSSNVSWVQQETCHSTTCKLASDRARRTLFYTHAHSHIIHTQQLWSRWCDKILQTHAQKFYTTRTTRHHWMKMNQVSATNNR